MFLLGYRNEDFKVCQKKIEQNIKEFRESKNKAKSN
jgi:hypothetical protein